MKDKFGVELEAGQQVLYAYKSGNGSVVYPSSLIVFQEVDTEDER